MKQFDIRQPRKTQQVIGPQVTELL